MLFLVIIQIKLGTHYMNWVDLIFIGIFLFSVLIGLARGLLGEVISLLLLVASFVIASMFAHPVAQMILGSPTLQGWLTSLSQTSGIDPEKAASYLAIAVGFMVVFILVSLVGMAIRAVCNTLLVVGVLGIGNRILGGVFGLARGFIINLIIIFIVQLTSYRDSPAWQQSQIVDRYQPTVAWLNDFVSPSLKDMKEKISSLKKT